MLWAGSVLVYTLRSAAAWGRNSLDGAPRNAGRFVLILRTFGTDGDLLVANRNMGPRELLPRVETLESIVASSSNQVGLDSVIGFQDRDMGLVPRSIGYFAAADQDWMSEFRVLISQATAIVVLSTPDVPLGASFRWELDQIKAEGLQDRTIVVAPPSLEAEAKVVVNQILTTLGWSAVDSTPLACYLGQDMRLRIHPSIGWQDDSLSRRYRAAITAGLEAVASRLT